MTAHDRDTLMARAGIELEHTARLTDAELDGRAWTARSVLAPNAEALTAAAQLRRMPLPSKP